ncbi:MAG TPA: hypothetical protein VGB47_01835 [Thermoanaerobaculia bacterium]
MSGRDARTHTRRIVSTLTLLLMLKAEGALSGAEVPRVEVGDPAALSGLNELVSRAVRDARAKLSEAGCSLVFGDFRDARGRTLQENLDSSGRTGAAYLEWLTFYDGFGKTRCEERGTLASTSPGSRVVYICSPQFMERQRRDPGLTAALIIHEELHSLGLGENPPSSQAITAQVIARCGR